MAQLILFVFAFFLTFGSQAQVVKITEDGVGLCSDNRAYVLVGGIGEDWRYFNEWIPQLSQDGCLFAHDPSNTSTSMPVSAKLLRDGLWGLQDQGFTKIVVLAHSMGGLVSRRALQLLAERERPQLIEVTLHAYGTPWGGYFWANPVRWTPFGDHIFSALGLPMSIDIGTSAPFMKTLQEPLPAYASMVIHKSDADDVAMPFSLAGEENFAALVLQANAVHTYKNIIHSEYVPKLSWLTETQ